MRPRTAIPFLAMALALAFSSACAPSARQIQDYEPRQRQYEFPVEAEELQSSRREGSLWSASDRANYFFTDQRAVRVGDILTVRVQEFATAQRATSTNTSRTTEMNASIREFLGLVASLQEIAPDLPVELAVEAGSSLAFDSRGETGRTEQLTATVQVIVKQTLPNGNLFIEGHRVILVNAEEHHFYVSGVARPHDIDEHNSIASSHLADAEIQFTGRGVLSDGERPGAFARFFARFWPF